MNPIDILERNFMVPFNIILPSKYGSTKWQRLDIGADSEVEESSRHPRKKLDGPF